MIGKLARRLGFQQSVPVALIDSWTIPTVTKPLVTLAPREGVAACAVDQFGRVQVEHATWTLELTIAAGARWVPAASTERIKQTLLSPGVLETIFTTPSGDVVQRVAAGVVDGQPAAIIEVENRGGVAVAIGMVTRPLRHDGRGFIGEATADAAGMTIDDDRVLTFATSPATVVAIEGSGGDLLKQMPDANETHKTASAKCRSGGAQAGVVWPLPHTATMRMVVALHGSTSSGAAVPTTDDINRGWQSHLKQGLRLDVNELPIGDDLAIAARSILTLWPESTDSGAAITAMSELGFGRDAGRLFELLERNEDDEDVVRALARWAQLGEQAHQLEDLDRILGRLAQAAHGVVGRGGEISGPAWLETALVTLGGRLHQIEQPDVGERIQQLVVTPVLASSTHVNAADQMTMLSKALNERGVWADGQVRSAAALVRSARLVLVEDAGGNVAVLPDMPKVWRGRTIDAFTVPVANGTLSFGLRWHGPRPALFWEASLAPEAPFEISAPGIDPAFSSTDRAGETLLADPGWPSS